MNAARPNPVLATAGGVGAVALLALALGLGPVEDELAGAVAGLVLVVPVVAAAVLGGRWPAYAVAAVATAAFSLVVPPVGSFRIRLGEDLVALAVFSLVGVITSTLVAARLELLGRVEEHRAVLLRSVSHDLRTPLATIRAAASELGEHGLHDERVRAELAALVGDEAERLDRLVANLLSLSRIEAGALRPSPQPVDVGELVELTTARLGRLVHGAPFLVDVAEDLPLVAADWGLLEQVLTNLVENAVRHTPPGTPVSVTVRAIDGTVRIEVADAGPGIEPDRRDAVLEPFRTGVGLAICRAIVEAHDGTIRIGEADGGGARITVVLPPG
jgi:K+-sensing histidine kinase KdpD